MPSRQKEYLNILFTMVEQQDKESIKKLDEYFEQGFNEKMNRFMLYPTEWEELKQKIFGGDLVK